LTDAIGTVPEVVDKGGKALKSVQELIEAERNLAESTIDMIGFTIDLTKGTTMADEPETDEPEAEPIEEKLASTSDPNCRCVCHPGNCTCKVPSNYNLKHKAEAALTKEQFSLAMNAMDQERECKCLMRRMQLDQETESSKKDEDCAEACVANCVCTCHGQQKSVEDEDHSKDCTGTCATHCPKLELPSNSPSKTSKEAENKSEPKPETEDPDSETEKKKEDVKLEKNEPGLIETEEGLPALVSPSATSKKEDEVKPEPNPVPEMTKESVPENKDGRRSSEKQSFVKRLSNSLRRSK
jgi:hypothetical protein